MAVLVEGVCLILPTHVFEAIVPSVGPAREALAPRGAWCSDGVLTRVGFGRAAEARAWSRWIEARRLDAFVPGTGRYSLTVDERTGPLGPCKWLVFVMLFDGHSFALSPSEDARDFVFFAPATWSPRVTPAFSGRRATPAAAAPCEMTRVGDLVVGRQRTAGSVVLVTDPERWTPLPTVTTADVVRGALARDGGRAPHGAQLDLVTEAEALRRGIEEAIWRADFADALRVRDILALDHGLAAVPRDLEFLRELAGIDWERGTLPPALRAWKAAEPLLATRERRDQVVDALFYRLAACFGAEQVVARDESCLPDVIDGLWRRGLGRTARAILRDALLRGIEPGSRAIDDPWVRIALRENVAPQWRACLGARLEAWPVPRPSEAEIGELVGAIVRPLPAATEARALVYWSCLRACAAEGLVSRDVQHEAHLRMRLLDQELQHSP